MDCPTVPTVDNTDYTNNLFLSFLTTGLRHNTSLKQLSVPIPLIEKITTFVNVISQKNNLTELKVNFTLDHLCSLEKLTLMLFDQGLPAVTTILRSHATIKQLKIACMYDINFHSFETDKWIEKIHNFYLAIFIHPSLEYVEIQNTPLVQSFTFLKEMMIGIRREAQPKTQLLIVSTSVLSISSLLFFDDYGKSSDRTINDVRKEKEDSFDIHGEKNKKDYYEESSQGNMDAYTRILHINDWNEIVITLKDKNFPNDKWYDFGLHLKVTYNQLEVIKRDNRECTDCLYKCIAEWLKTGKATYRKLIDAVRGIKEDAVADNIEKHVK
ncbi:PREDICTED: uncharacterized protein LOC109584975 [Amphimedon queenslandica]|uniref:Death domain-containing protein n=1 Tax=Amphimedon queenslandica TaxID=400682 RepID=A0AAN0JHD1_AMPQE|nr:PREDICTED: uncharacterized protein LOC109584975 [Amphimedon queenslandica]|eukprot:XP_019856440.1 PREDICTED: uncharacterized protein LOC109584975 [Amphimedon queenslandica]